MSIKQKGFTLIELVAVIIILGVLATATTQYITFGAQVYVESTERQRVLSQSRFFVERLVRELRLAMPNSVRTTANGSCIEFVPVKASGAYRTDSAANLAPIAPNPAASTIDVISYDIASSSVNDRIYIYPTSPADVYVQSNEQDDKWSRLFSVTVTPSQSSPQFRITLKDEVADTNASNERFPEESPVSRFYVADVSINYCLVSGQVLRFVKSDFNSVQSTGVPNGIAGILMAEGLTNTNAEPAFSYSSVSQARNAVVSLYLEFEANIGENMFFNHEVHIPNVP